MKPEVREFLERERPFQYDLAFAKPNDKVDVNGTYSLVWFGDRSLIIKAPKNVPIIRGASLVRSDFRLSFLKSRSSSQRMSTFLYDFEYQAGKPFVMIGSDKVEYLGLERQRLHINVASEQPLTIVFHRWSRNN